MAEDRNGLLGGVMASALTTSALTYELLLANLQCHIVDAGETGVVVPEGKSPSLNTMAIVHGLV